MGMNNCRILNKFLVLLLTFTIASCGGAGAIWSWQYDNLPAEKTGIVFTAFSTSNNVPNGTRVRLVVRSIAENAFASITHVRVEGESEFQEGVFEGGVTPFRLLPGNYELMEVTVTYPVGVPRGWTNKEPYHYRFSIEAGKATYLGYFAFQPDELVPVLGMKMPWKFKVDVANRLTRDLALLEKQGHNYSPQNIIDSVMSKSDTKGTVFFRVD